MSIQREIERIYEDEYIVEEDQMGESGSQDWSVRDSVGVLEWQYLEEHWMVAVNRNHYHNAIDNSEKLIVPDIAFFKNIPIPLEEQPLIVSWDMRSGNRAAPPLVIEMSSASTYKGDIDLDKKPRLYGLIGVSEYFAYDPNRPRAWPRRYRTRLLGWRYNAAGQPQPIQANEQGWLWSEVLDSWLGPDELYLAFYDRAGNRRPTAKQALAAAREKADAARAEAEQRATVEQSAREQAEQQLAELQRQLEELRRQQRQ